MRHRHALRLVVHPMMFDRDDGFFVRLLTWWLVLCGLCLPFYIGYMIFNAVTR